MPRLIYREESKEETGQAIRRLGSPNAEARALAEADLLQQGAETVPELVAAHDRLTRQAGRLLYTVIGLGCLGMASLLLDNPLFAFFLLAGLILCAFLLGPLSRSACGLLRVLERLDDPRAVGPLAEVMATWSEQEPASGLRAGACASLMRLLPQLTAEEAAGLNDYQRACLRGALSKQRADREPALVQAILAALPVIADERALPHVEELAWGRVANENQQRIQAAAQACLPLLRQRVEHEQAARTLLRPAQSVAETDPATQLRPVSDDSHQAELSALDALITALDAEDNHARTVAHEALADLLPRLQEEDAEWLTPAHHARLGRVLRFSNRFAWPVHRDVPLVLAILEALKRVGRPQAIPEVEGLASSAREPRIRDAARACLPALRLRAAQERRSSRLLRPAQNPTLLRPAVAPVESLPRPVVGEEEADPARLLRPDG